ncbi:MAG: glycosyltransferase [Candidatus Pelethousia sp.]|nr:glycosyltransferase [Candidatus Pelethousia sp.]
MIILQCSDSFLPIVDGVGRVVYNYAYTLAEKGHECYVCAPMRNAGYRGGWPFELVDFTGTPVPGSPQYTMGFPVLDKHYHARMNRIVPQIVHAHTPFFAGQEAMRISLKHNVPLVATFHSKYYDDFYKATGGSGRLATLGVKLVVDFYEHCDEVWAVSQPSADVLREYGYKGEVVVMENGTNLAPIRPEDKARAAEFVRTSPDEKILLYVGQLNWKKNILHILEACARMKKQGVCFRLALVGQGPDEEAIRERVVALGLSEQVVFTGHILDNSLLNGLYQLADLFVFPSVYDTSSLVLREAAAMGTPSVVTAGSCPAEVVHHGENGFLAENTSEDLAGVIHSALMRDDLSSIGERARNTIPVPWSVILDRALARYTALIEACSHLEAKPRHEALRERIRCRLAAQQKIE